MGISVPYITGNWLVDFWLMIFNAGIHNLNQLMGWLALGIALVLPFAVLYGIFLIFWHLLDTLTGGMLSNYDVDKKKSRSINRNKRGW